MQLSLYLDEQRVLNSSENEGSIPGATKGKTQEYYNYSNVKNSETFETPNNDGIYTIQNDEQFYFYGKTYKTHYTLDGNERNDNLTWWDYTKISIDIAGALIETGVGVLTSETGIGTGVAIDGFLRVVGNVNKLTNMIETGSRSQTEHFATNGGQMVGAAVDYYSGNNNHQAQNDLGFLNDVATLPFHDQTSIEWLNGADASLNGLASPNTWRGIGEEIGLGF